MFMTAVTLSIPSDNSRSGGTLQQGECTPSNTGLASNDRGLRPHNMAVNEYTRPEEPEEPFSIYTKQGKWLMVGMASFAGLFRYVTATMFNAFGYSV